ncbi:UNKNOWN [Stylonychia lemnae]|uniref:Uncharacterized protein n=1 Tax=Stylonychia lemnae TaxID=5949 RepID=A0A078AUN6_STYLE|nr:UNKNOWN [Stylonychia lemnae]|eukprot:CDW85889.1 UNKNOWN [Stylonychia lemnae]
MGSYQVKITLSDNANLKMSREYILNLVVEVPQEYLDKLVDNSYLSGSDINYNGNDNSKNIKRLKLTAQIQSIDQLGKILLLLMGKTKISQSLNGKFWSLKDQL